MTTVHRLLSTAAALAGLIALTTCATNPVSGKSELALVSESQEIDLGKQGAADVAQTIGLYQNDAVQAYVSRLGLAVAAKTQRPNLPWQFHVVDDPAINAFALPGGPIFVTRGLMTVMTNEAELVTVLGHESGHIAARHTVQQMSRQQVAQLGLGIGSILSPTVAKYGSAASAGLGLLFLKFSRDDEAQADLLGFGYALADGYDVRQMKVVFQTLEALSASSGGGQLPEWESTHPAPANRIQATDARVAALKPGQLNGKLVNRDQYMRQIDGMVYGEDPRQGFFQGPLFLDPAGKFQIRFPQGWTTQNQAQAVMAGSPGQDAIIQLSLGGPDAPAQAAQKFFSQQGLTAGQTSPVNINGLSAVSGGFTAQAQDGSTVQGVATFLSYNGTTYQILGYAPTAKYASYDGAFHSAVWSFSQLTDPRVLSVQPMRIQLVRAPRQMTLDEFNRQFPSSVPLDQLALINELDKNATVASGQTMKRVVGTALPGN